MSTLPNLWTYNFMALLGGDGKFERWGLIEGRS